MSNDAATALLHRSEACSLPSIPQSPKDVPEFYVSELARAAHEQQFGVQKIGTVTASTPPSMPGATVEITLLEERTITIKLSLAGYRVVSIGSASHSRVFETIEALLEEESPQWAIKRMDVLMFRLAQIAEDEGVEK